MSYSGQTAKRGQVVTITEIMLLGLALAMDAFAVTISNTFIYQGNSKLRNLMMPIAFGLFQGIMPCIGYVLGRLVSDVISQYAGIITFAILGFIGMFSTKKPKILLHLFKTQAITSKPILLTHLVKL